MSRRRKIPRKTARELRLEERLRGFYECLQIFEDLWRSKANERMKRGISMRDAFSGPVSDALWEGIEKAQKQIHPVDNEYKSIYIPRLYGEESAVDQLAEVGRGA